MDSYKVLFRKSAEKELRGAPKKDLKRLVEKIELLTRTPRPQGNEKLSGEERYRLRQGDWRIIYEIDDETKTILIVKIGHRREIYR